MLNIYTMLLALLMAELLPYVVVHVCGADILLTNGLSFVNAYMYTRPRSAVFTGATYMCIPADGYCCYCCVQGMQP